MTVYTRHRLSEKTKRVLPMEAFPSVERASVALVLRVTQQESRTFYMTDSSVAGSAQMGGSEKFPEADQSGFMAVWLRRARELPPQPGEEPDEVWRVSARGAVRRAPWDDSSAQALGLPVSGCVPTQKQGKEPEGPDLSLPHPPYWAETVAFWLHGRMDLRDVRSGKCPCPAPDLHQPEVVLSGALVPGDPYALGLPPEVPLWHFRAGAPTQQAAVKVARTGAKSLGFTMNPAFEEKCEEKHG